MDLRDAANPGITEARSYMIIQAASSSQRTAAPPFLPELESLRGLAAFAVVIEHCFTYSDTPAVGWLERHNTFSGIMLWLIHFVFNGRAAVVLFFVISGFVLARQLNGLFVGAYPRLQSYFIRRFFRIVPPMWVAVLFGYVVALYFRPDLTVNVTLLWHTLVLQDIVLDTPLWSLQVEIGCCVVFPLLYLFNLDASRRAAFSLVPLLSLLLLLPIGLTFGGAMRYLVFFQLGILVGSHGASVVNVVSRAWRRPLFLFSCAMLSLAFLLWPFLEVFTFFNDTNSMLMAIPFSFVVLAYVVHGNDRMVQWVLRSRVALFLGKISFSLYLLHYVISNTMWPIYALSPKFVFTWTSPLGQAGLFLLFVLAVSLPLATLMYHYIEMPLSNLGRRLSRYVPLAKTHVASAA
jgi:peptidoglycan/LPS O-acetylase OafA/YrhL